VTVATYERPRGSYGSPSLRPLGKNTRSQSLSCNSTHVIPALVVDPSSALGSAESSDLTGVSARRIGLRVEGSTRTTGLRSSSPPHSPGNARSSP
jgi:hypothetical protein